MGASFREGELHLNSFSRVIAQGADGGNAGVFKGIVLEGGAAVIAIGGEKFRLLLSSALALAR